MKSKERFETEKCFCHGLWLWCDEWKGHRFLKRIKK